MRWLVILGVDEASRVSYACKGPTDPPESPDECYKRDVTLVVQAAGKLRSLDSSYPRSTGLNTIVM